MGRPLDTLAKRLKHARLKRGLKQTPLAEMSGVKQSDLSKLETGKSLKTTGMARLASALRVPALWLELGDGPEPDWDSEAAGPAPGPRAPEEATETTPGALGPAARTEEERRALVSLRRLAAPTRAEYVQTIEAAAAAQMDSVRQWIRDHLGITRVLTDQEVEEGFRRAAEQMATNTTDDGDDEYNRPRRDLPPAQVEDRSGKSAKKKPTGGGRP